MDKRALLVGMPAYNEGKTIAHVINHIKSQGYPNVLVVNDGSKDDTALKARAAGAIVVSHPINRGAGAATLTALMYARTHTTYSHLILLDSDGQHDPKDIERLMAYGASYDVVIGSRLLTSKHMPLQRRIANIFGSFITWLFFGLYVYDSQSGFKVFNRHALNKINFIADKFEFCSEVIGEIEKHKLKVKEVPIKVIYTGESIRKGQNILNGFRMIRRFLLNY
ncbi:MAG: glycosyltransferase family 2 protein [Candidatus Woesearchaeota archaeon]|nr:MAG: glycosyltransferase family 2 protein [Candidatus Woesearchaeota archaeon]